MTQIYPRHIETLPSKFLIRKKMFIHLSVKVIAGHHETQTGQIFHCQTVLGLDGMTQRLAQLLASRNFLRMRSGNCSSPQLP